MWFSGVRDTEHWQQLDTAAKASLVVYVASQYAFVAAIPVAFLAALADWRLGGYVLIIAVGVQIVGRQLAARVFASQLDRVETTHTERLVSNIDVVFWVLVLGGLFAALAGWTPGAAVAVAGLVGHLASHVVVGALGYRRVMRRPWPQVPPVVEDDDW